MTRLTQIIAILHLIYKIWKKNQSLRLVQLIGNCFKPAFDLYYITDKELEMKLRETYKEKEE